MSHKTTTHWKGGMLFESDNPSGKTVLMDTVVNYEYVFLCSGVDIVEILEKMKVIDYKLSIDIEGFLTDEHPKYYHKVHVDYHFHGKDLNPKKINKAVTLSVEKYCGVMEMFRQFATVTTEIHIHNS